MSNTTIPARKNPIKITLKRTRSLEPISEFNIKKNFYKFRTSELIKKSNRRCSMRSIIREEDNIDFIRPDVMKKFEYNNIVKRHISMKRHVSSEYISSLTNALSQNPFNYAEVRAKFQESSKLVNKGEEYNTKYVPMYRSNLSNLFLTQNVKNNVNMKYTEDYYSVCFITIIYY